MVSSSETRHGARHSMTSGKVFWITGASSGIGAALAKEVARRGARVVVSGRRVELLERLRAECPEPSRVHLLPADLSRGSDLQRLARRAEQFEGRLDVLVNNAGVSQRGRALGTLLEDVRTLMEVNFLAPITLTNAVLPAMLRRGDGRIVVLSSVAGYVGTPLRSSYAASKHAVRGYFDSLRAELAGGGVGVTIVCPGYVRTEISERAVAEGGRRHGVTDRCIDRGMPAESCARTIADAIEQGKSELHVGGREVLAIYAKRLLPGFVERLVPKGAPT